MLPIESTYKAKDVEETLDVYFYRPLGYGIALASRGLGLTPNALTIIGAVIGVIAGHLFYYNNLSINVIGILLLLVAEIIDSADGQLARMTNRFSKHGRILDGLGDNLKFVSIYFHLGLRIAVATGWWWIFVLIAVAGASHSWQSAMADYYRTAYIYFVVDRKRDGRENGQDLLNQYGTLKWKDAFIKKLLLRMYVNYTLQQEMLSKNFQRLEGDVSEKYDSNLPQWFADRYRELNRPLIKYYNILTTNTRMIVLIAALLINRVYVYFAFELIVLNILLAVVTIRQEKISKKLLRLVDSQKGAA